VARSKRRLLAEDDLLKGFDKTGPSRGKLGGFFAVTIGASLYAWHLAFTFGAYDTLFYHRRHQLFVLSVVVLLGGLILRSRMQIRPWLLALFAPPLLRVLLQLVFPVTESTGVTRIAEGVLNIAIVAVLPIVAWVVARLLAPDYFTLPDRRVKIAVIAVVAAVALIGYFVGRFNDRFLTCEDFRIAGDAEPANCAPAQQQQ
jgi:hypothetical protein